MKVVKLNCTACGAPISIPENIDQLNCSACGSFLQVDRGEGYIALRILEKITKAIETSGKETTDAIKESSHITKTELQKLQIQQEIIANQTLLANIESEIRYLKRTGVDKIGLNEIDGLYIKQYHLLDKLRILEQKYLSPKPGDVEGLIYSTQKELSFIDQELSVLNLSNNWEKYDAIKTLNKMRSERVYFITNLRANELRKNFPILLQKSYAVEDTQTALDYLGKFSEAEKSIHSLSNSAEKNLLLEEIKKQKAILLNDWSELEKARLSVMLHFIPPIPKDEDMQSLIAKKGYIDENINILQSQTHNWVVQNLLTENQNRSAILQKRILSFEKQIQKEQSRLAKEIAIEKRKSENPNQNQPDLESYFAKVGVYLSGIWLTLRNSLPIPNSKYDLVSLSSENENFESDNFNREMNQSYLNFKSVEESSSKSINKGILHSIIFLVSFSCIGVFLLAVINSIFSIDSSSVPVGFLFLILLLIGSLVAQKIFMSQAFGLVFIKGLWRIPNIYLSTNHPTHGIQNNILIKILVGLFVFITFGFFIFSLAISLPYAEDGKLSNLAGSLILFGFFFSPLLGFIASLRTKIISSDPIN
jgi:hypothetical protein